MLRFSSFCPFLEGYEVGPDQHRIAKKLANEEQKAGERIALRKK